MDSLSPAALSRSSLEIAETFPKTMGLALVEHGTRCGKSGCRCTRYQSNGQNVHLMPSFVTDTAGKVGVSERTVRRDVQIGERIAADVRDLIRDTDAADSKADLLELARLSEGDEPVTRARV